MKATKLLQRQHRDVQRLFDALKTSDDPVVRGRCLDEILARLAAHMIIEELIFYPRVAATETSGRRVAEAYEEHHVAKLVLAELPEMFCDAASFKAKISVLADLVHDHVVDEERDVFPNAEKLLGDRALEALGVEMEAAFIAQLGGAY